MTSFECKRDIEQIKRNDYDNNYVTYNTSIQQFKLRVIRTTNYVTEETNIFFKNQVPHVADKYVTHIMKNKIQRDLSS